MLPPRLRRTVRPAKRWRPPPQRPRPRRRLTKALRRSRSTGTAAARGASVCWPDRDGDGPPDRLHLRRLRPAAPLRQIDHLILPEAQRRMTAVERDRHQPVAVAGVRRPRPCTQSDFDRALRPQDDDGVRLCERVVDRACEARTALDQRVPPDGVAGLFECGGDALRTSPCRRARSSGRSSTGLHRPT